MCADLLDLHTRRNKLEVVFESAGVSEGSWTWCSSPLKYDI